LQFVIKDLILYMTKKPTQYLEYILNPFNIFRTKEILKVNPTVIPERSEENTPTKIFVYDYNPNSITEVSVDKVEDSFHYLQTDKISWINVDGIRKTDVEKICEHYNIHFLIAEDIQSVNQRAKTDEIDGVLYCVLNMIYFNDNHSSVESEQISIVLGKNYVITFQEDAKRDVFNPLREKLKLSTSKVRQMDADYLCYMMLDLIVDNYFIVMEKLGEKVENLEEDIAKNPNNKTLAKINMLRKEMIVLKRTIAPVRELVNGFIKSDSDLLSEKNEKYYKDVYDHIIQANDLAENYRDMLMNLQDLYLSNVNLKLNEAMKVMAVVTCILAPATVIGGIFGMNFKAIEYIDAHYGFIIAAILMISIPIIMIYIFRKRGWF
jgi:magnesium transporter